MKKGFILLIVFLSTWNGGIVASADSISQVFKTVSSSVALIKTVQKQPAPGPRNELITLEGLGSGVLISEDGLVMTASHVVHTADDILVGFPTGEVIRAQVVASEPGADVALLKLLEHPINAQPVPLGNSDLTEVGEEIFIVGAPFGVSHTLTVGHISARRMPNTRELFKGFAIGEFFQTDAAINQGNSGGPMFNLQGEVIGIVRHIISKTGGYEGLGFVVTSNMARQLLLEKKSVWNGVRAFLLTGDLAKAFHLPQPTGFLIQQVAEQSFAARAGLQGGTIKAIINEVPVLLGGDIVLEVLGIRVEETSIKEIRKKMNQLTLGGEINMTVWRGGQHKELSTLRLRSP